MNYILNGEKYRQIEIEVEEMDEDRTVLFLVPEKNYNEYCSKIEKLMWEYNFTEKEVVNEISNIYYMCSLYDNRIER